jgi:hypothetical protein
VSGAGAPAAPRAAAYHLGRVPGDGARVADPLAAVARAAATLAPVGLDRLATAALMDRVDTKYLVPADRVAALLHEAGPAYRILEVEGRRLARYHTRYFDTEALALYHAHHRGRALRHKVRIRSYLDLGHRYLEVKRRANTGRTTKARVRLPDGAAEADALAALAAEPLRALAPDDPAHALRPTVDVAYTRVTLVHLAAAERVTLDLLLTVRGRDGEATFPAVATVEVKQARRGHSAFADALRRAGGRAESLSKYCLAVATCDRRARSNRFRPLLHAIHRIGRLHGTPADAR